MQGNLKIKSSKAYLLIYGSIEHWQIRSESDSTEEHADDSDYNGGEVNIRREM